MTVPSVILWDVGGTIVDHVMSQEGYVQRALQPTGIALEALDWTVLQAIQREREVEELGWGNLAGEQAGYVAFAQRILAGVDATTEQIEAFGKGLRAYFDMYGPVPGITEVLQEVDDAGVTQGVVSNWPPSLNAFLEFHRVRQYFRIIMCSGEQGIAKPDHQLFQRALYELGVEAGDCVYIGDNPKNDIQPARELGMQAIHFNPRGNYAQSDARNATELRACLVALGLLRGSPRLV